MGWFVTAELDEYRAAAGSLLAARPVQNTLLLTVLDSLRAKGTAAYGPVPPLFGWWRPPGGEVAAAFLHTPPYELLLSALPAGAAGELADLLVKRGWSVFGVNGTDTAAAEFAARWAARTGASWRVRQRHRLHRLLALTPPDPTPRGRPRSATAADVELLTVWWEEFARETDHPAGNTAALVADRLDQGGLLVWQVDDAPVSFAAISRAVAGAARIGPVYTHVAHRRRGYAAGVTAAATTAARNAGAQEVLLFTDLAHPTSNALYQRLGYAPLEDRTLLSFTL